MSSKSERMWLGSSSIPYNKFLSLWPNFLLYKKSDFVHFIFVPTSMTQTTPALILRLCAFNFCFWSLEKMKKRKFGWTKRTCYTVANNVGLRAAVKLPPMVKEEVKAFKLYHELLHDLPFTQWGSLWLQFVVSLEARAESCLDGYVLRLGCLHTASPFKGKATLS